LGPEGEKEGINKEVGQRGHPLEGKLIEEGTLFILGIFRNLPRS
jgi:hypothetical protein